jgi:hypothetical protein
MTDPATYRHRWQHLMGNLWGCRCLASRTSRKEPAPGRGCRAEEKEIAALRPSVERAAIAMPGRGIVEIGTRPGDIELVRDARTDSVLIFIRGVEVARVPSTDLVHGIVITWPPTERSHG